jgi:uncharacterized protein YbjT (DUF2867 family)
MKATLIGATGLIGESVLEALIEDSDFSDITILVRKSYESQSSKVKVRLVDFDNLDEFNAAIDPESTIFCAVGTTRQKVKGDMSKYRKVDYDIPVNAAVFGLKKNCKSFVLVSSIGADSKSSNFYTKLKGEVEDKISTLDYNSFHVFRPSLLLGNRKEFRFAEKLAQVLMTTFSFLIPKHYKAINAKHVGYAMKNAAKQNIKGKHIYTFKEIKDLAHK